MRNLNIAHHPRALWFLSVSQTFYCVSIGATTSLLILYLIYKVQVPPTRAYEVFAAMNSLIYVLPLAGGYLGEKLGYILTIIFGFAIVFVGFVLLSIPEVHLMYIGVACFAAGNALVVPNTNALVGLHYAKDSILRNSGYTLYFLIYNIGFLISPIIAGYVSLDNYNLAFLVSALSVVMAFLVFIYCIQKIEIHPSLSFSSRVHYSARKRLLVLGVFSFLAIFGTLFLLQQENFNDKFLSVLAFLVAGGLILSTRKQNRSGRLKIFSFLILCILSIAFWALYMLVPSFLTIFIAENINRNIFGFVLPPSCYYALDAFFVILLGFFFSWFWHYCAERKKDISLPAKFASSLLAIGLAYLILVIGITFANHNTHLVSSLWIVLAYILIAIGELLISPIALAMVGVLMPKGQEGLGMGIWQAFIGFSAIISGFLANLVNTPRQGDPILTNPLYLDAFLKMGLVTLAIGIIILLLVPKIKKTLQL